MLIKVDDDQQGPVESKKALPIEQKGIEDQPRSQE